MAIQLEFYLWIASAVLGVLLLLVGSRNVSLFKALKKLKMDYDAAYADGFLTETEKGLLLKDTVRVLGELANFCLSFCPFCRGPVLAPV